MMKKEKNEDELFLGEVVVAGGYDAKRETWKLFYEELDWEERLVFTI